MDSLLVDASSAASRGAVVNNLIDYFVSLDQSDGAEVQSGPGYTRWHTPISHPWYNGVTCTLSPDKDACRFAEESIEHFKARDVRVFSWWCRSAQSLTEWEPVLASLGFRRDDATPGMAVCLPSLHREYPFSPRLEIRVVRDLPALAEWVHTLIVGYELPRDWEDSFYRMLAGMTLDWPVHYYLGYLNGHPVATSNAYLASGVVGVYCVATLPEARGQGLGAAVTLASLEDGERLGYHVGVLQSSKMGYGVYQRLGFQHVCQIDHFVWANGTDQP